MRIRSLLPCALLLVPIALAAQAPAPASPPGAAAGDVSTIVLPVNASLAPLLPQVETQVPRTFASAKGTYEMEPQGRFGLKYDLVRDPIRLNQQGLGLHVTTRILYALEGCTRTRKGIVTGDYQMWPCVSCGYGEPMRQALIYLDTYLDWDADWRLRSRTKARPADFPNRCGVSVFGIDITDRYIAPMVNQQLQNVARTIDRQTPKLTSMRADAARVWASLQAPVEVAPGAWLVIEPLDIAVTPITGSGLKVTSSLVLRTRTRIVIGAKPPTQTKPLPPLQTTKSTGDGFHIAATVELPYGEAGRMLTAQFAAKYKVNGRDLTLRALTLQPGPDGKIEVDADIDYRGGTLRSYNGVIHLEGQPVYDAATARLSLAGLDYSLDPRRRNPFLRTADRFAHDLVRKALADNAVWTVGPQVAAIRGEVEKGLNRPIAPNATLRATVTGVQPTGLVLAPQGIVINVLATGNARVDVK